jgi:tetratricopeptide (TPR) repeat protein
LAEEVFLLNTRLGPEIANTWDSLADAQMALGKTEEAIASFEKVLGIDADNERAEEMIGKLRGESE